MMCMHPWKSSLLRKLSKLKGLCYGSPVHFVSFCQFNLPSIAIELKVSNEPAQKQNYPTDLFKQFINKGREA